MNYLTSVLAGLVEGLSSALPLSESGHRRIFETLGGEIPAFMPLAVVLAMVLVFHKTVLLTLGSLLDLFKKAKAGTFRWKKANRYQKLALFAPIGAIPYWLICFLQTKYAILDGLGSTLLLVGILLILNAGILFIGDFSVEKDWDHIDMTVGHSIKLGLFQAASFLPGFSRVAMTLCMARNMGFAKECALEFSMMTGIWALLGRELITLQTSTVADWSGWAVAFGATFLASLGGLWLLKALVKHDKTYLLMICSVAAGIGAIILNF